MLIALCCCLLLRGLFIRSIIICIVLIIAMKRRQLNTSVIMMCTIVINMLTSIFFPDCHPQRFKEEWIASLRLLLFLHDDVEVAEEERGRGDDMNDERDFCEL